MIILCAASDDYIEKYKPCIDSQINYCKKYDYEYKLISGKKEDRNWKRTKIDELKILLENTDSDVLLIDADCLIKDNCPMLTEFLNNKSIYYANGHSGRLNSGFLYFKNCNKSLEFVKELQEKLKLPIPRGKGYFVSKTGENGHIIWIKSQWIEEGKDIFKNIGINWNCTLPSKKDSAFILHFTGPMKQEYIVD